MVRGTFAAAAVLLLACGPLTDAVRGGPDLRVGEYVRALAAGSRATALETWVLPDRPRPNSEVLASRRIATTDALIATRVAPTFAVRRIEWWATCCEPRVVDGPSNAGGARLFVDLRDRDGHAMPYVFDVFHRATVYWGDAEGNPPHDWVLRDAYAEGQTALFWTR